MFQLLNPGECRGSAIPIYVKIYQERNISFPKNSTKGRCIVMRNTISKNKKLMVSIPTLVVALLVVLILSLTSCRKSENKPSEMAATDTDAVVTTEEVKNDTDAGKKDESSKDDKKTTEEKTTEEMSTETIGKEKTTESVSHSPSDKKENKTDSKKEGSQSNSGSTTTGTSTGTSTGSATSNTGGSSSGNTNQGVSGTQASSPVWHEPVVEKKWVVDTPAWDEEFPVYETRYREVCGLCGGYMYSEDDIINHFTTVHPREAGSWYDESYQVQTGTYTVHHDEIGHWEEVVIKEGYWE